MGAYRPSSAIQRSALEDLLALENAVLDNRFRWGASRCMKHGFEHSFGWNESGVSDRLHRVPQFVKNGPRGDRLQYPRMSFVPNTDCTLSPCNWTPDPEKALH
ncbi:hypothetical protein OIU76_018181 [Salix suchowensis]|uniref:Uncharacterized protein n=1 Tax=Salix suchowensis TaxID=1278906 RepID=A0ABQ9C3P0_9ROSI|nr:hypothetical protein OIU76_018181 [Salix suchowensis]KAJ6342243.1 hypothetical protein OIU78_010218 [Salix suchowensis]KAJ6394162.1 hypothetical protein OIU77_023399 [Salix suchowensis]